MLMSLLDNIAMHSLQSVQTSRGLWESQDASVTLMPLIVVSLAASACNSPNRRLDDS